MEAEAPTVPPRGPAAPWDAEALGLQPLQTHATAWRPTAEHGFRVALNLALDGCIVPTLDGAARGA
jgi:hypothetical protein